MGKFRLTWFTPVLACLVVGCGSSSSGSGFSPPAPPPPPPPPVTPTVDVQRVFPNLTFSSPVSLQQAPGDESSWFVVEQNGVIREFLNDQGSTATSVFLDISSRVQDGGERGLLGLAFDPLFPTVEDVYVSYTAIDPVEGLVSIVSRFALQPGGDALDPGSEELILVVAQDQSNHNGGEIAFDQDGYLYLGLGDGGGAGDPNERAQDNTNLLGTMVRIDIDTGSPYAIPSDNPFAANPVCVLGSSIGGENCPEIFAYGLRNPWRFSFDRQTGSLWAGDVGQGDWEEINLVTLGDDYGWNDREGAHCFDPAVGCDTNSIDPVTEYDHSLGASVTGGFVYRGTAIAELTGWYVFGDFISGRIFAVPADSSIGTPATELLDTGLSISAFAQDDQGELYVVDYGGEIHQIVDAP